MDALNAELEKNFTYHAPKPGQPERYDASEALNSVLEDCFPTTPEGVAAEEERQRRHAKMGGEESACVHPFYCTAFATTPQEPMMAKQRLSRRELERLLYERIREKAKELAYLITQECPPSRERSVALTELETSVFWANAAIARNEQ